MKWILGASVIAAVVALTATITIPAATITPDDATLKLFPQETQGVAFIDVAAIRLTPLFQDLLAQGRARSPRRLGEFITETGFVPERDVDNVTVGRLGARDFVAIVKARYDRVRAEYFLNLKQIPFETYMGRVVYHPGPKATVAFIDGLIVGGSDQGVKAAIDRMGSAPPSTVVQNAKIMDKIRSVEAGNQIWAVGEFSADMIPRGMKAPPQAAVLLQTFRGGVYQMRIDQDVHATATGNFDSADDARTAGDLLRGLLAIAKLQVSTKSQDLLHLLDGVRIDYSRETMSVGFDASGDLLKKLGTLRPTIGTAQ